jgi:eukaryotic-like serine/threonine-protein kinase
MQESLQPDTAISHYCILSKLGAGGMGEVYLAQDMSELERTVAIKLLPSEVASDPKRMQRFVQEARTVSALNHPNILTIYEFGQEGATRFISTEYVDGMTLREHLRGHRMKLHEVLDIAMQIAAALDAAHEANVVHRDIKPDNIMVRRRDHIVKVLDFGLAKPVEKIAEVERPAIDSEAGTKLLVNTEPGVVMGTVSYMSPEQSVGKTRVDHRTDIWSLGAVLYEMVAGRVPFEGKDMHRQIIAIQEQEPQPLSRFAPDVPERLEDIVTKALAKDPGDRYQTAKDLLIDLRNLKRKLEVGVEIDRTVPPEMRVAASTCSGQSVLATASGATATTSQASVVPVASSAEYIVTGIKHHKIVAAIAVAALLVAGVGLAAYLHARNTEMAIDSIAVLPFVNQNRDPDSEYLSDGLTESIINNLTQLPSLRVSPRSTVFQYKGKDTDPLKVGHDLGVRAVLTGRLQQRGDNLFVSAELLDVRDNKQVWGEQYNRKVADALAVQQEISREISERLRTKLSGEEQRQLTRRDTTNPEAYGFYLKGRYYWEKRTGQNLKKAVDQFQQAADKDPNYALAYVGLADCYLLLEDYVGTPASETYPKAEAFAERALQLDSSLAEAHTSLAYVYIGLWQWEQAEQEFKRAIKLNPNYPTAHHWYSLYLLDLGRNDEAMAEIKRAHELDPPSLIIGTTLNYVYLAEGDVNSSIAQCKRVIDLEPSFSRAHEYLGLAYLRQGSHSEAIMELQKAVELSGRDRRPLRDLGYVYAASGKRAEALTILKELEGRYERHEAIGQDFAAVYAGLGEKDQAFAWLEKDFQARSGLLAWIRWTPPFDSLHSDPRFAELLRRMGLKP